MEQTPNFNIKWFIMTSVMGSCWIVCVTLLILQNRAIKYQMADMPSTLTLKKKETNWLYRLFFAGAICATQCWICHASMLMPDLICIAGYPACVIFYAGTKTFLYAFFLERARCVRTYVKWKHADLIYDKLLPAWIVAYFVVFLILAPAFFRGKQNEDADLVTGCVFDTHFAWLYFLAAATDITNAVLFLGLFIYPLKKLIANQKNEVKQDVVNMIKINIFNTAICMVSSVILLLILGLSLTFHAIMDYVWFGGGIDIIVNCVSTFLMVKMNRNYMSHLCCGCCRYTSKKVLAKMGIEYANKNGNQMEQNDTITTDNGMVLHLHDWDMDNEDQSTQSVPTQSATSTMTRTTIGAGSIQTTQPPLRDPPTTSIGTGTPISTTTGTGFGGKTTPLPTTTDQCLEVEITMDAECVEIEMEV